MILVMVTAAHAVMLLVLLVVWTTDRRLRVEELAFRRDTAEKERAMADKFYEMQTRRISKQHDMFMNRIKPAAVRDTAADDKALDDALEGV